jgi:taurine dioxygenase
MARIEVKPLRDDLPFGARISGVTKEVLKDEAVRQQINDVFEDRGMIAFEDVEPCSHLQVALSKVFGPLKDHPIPAVPRAIEDLAPGVIDVMTGFADGADLYRRLSSKLRDQIEGCNIIYTMYMAFDVMRFGVPEGFREILQHPGLKGTLDHAKTAPRAIHPAVWTRKSGEKVLHLSPWMAVGIEGRESPEGDALLEAVCQEMIANIRPYHHKWRATDMLIWDNWRMLHSVTGHDPTETRCIHRTTIKGDYGLGRFENNDAGRYEVLEMTI